MLLRTLILPLHLSYKHLNNEEDAIQCSLREDRIIKHIGGLDHVILPRFSDRGHNIPIIEGDKELRVMTRWCLTQFGRRGRYRAWNYVPGIFAFREAHDAFAFKMRWAGTTPTRRVR